MTLVSGNVTGRDPIGPQGASPSPMSLEDFIRNFGLPPIVPIKRSCELQGCGHSKLYSMRAEGKLRIVPRAGGTGVPVEDHYKIYLAAVQPSPA